MAGPWIEEEIREQPAVIARFLERAEEPAGAALGDRDPRRLHHVGCGDMFFAAEAAAWIAGVELARSARAWRSMDLRWVAPRLTGEDLVVCASVSGRTPRTLEAALAARRAGAPVVGVTDDESSPLARAVDALVPLRASPPASLRGGDYPGYQHQVAQTKTFTATLLAEIALATYAAERSLSRLAGVPRAIAAATAAVEPAIRAGAAAWFEGRERVVVLASGPHLPIARYGAAKLLEYAVDARAQCIEEFNHLEAFVTDERALLVLLAPDAPSTQRAAELLDAWSELRARTVIVGGDAPGLTPRAADVPLPRGTAIETMFSGTVALQWLAYLGAATLGRDPDAWLGGVRTELFQRLSQVTVRGSAVVEKEWQRED